MTDGGIDRVGDGQQVQCLGYAAVLGEGLPERVGCQSRPTYAGGRTPGRWFVTREPATLSMSGWWRWPPATAPPAPMLSSAPCSARDRAEDQDRAGGLLGVGVVRGGGLAPGPDGGWRRAELKAGRNDSGSVRAK